MQTMQRMAQPGDLCILIQPAPDEAQVLYRQQVALQARYGGRIMQPVHLTCQRFEALNGSLDRFVVRLHDEARTVAPFALTAQALSRVYSPYRAMHILKWEVGVTDELQRSTRWLEALLDTLGIPSLYGAGWQSTLVTALEDVGATAELQPVESLPHHLFTARQLVLSRICGPFAFENLARFEL